MKNQELIRYCSETLSENPIKWDKNIWYRKEEISIPIPRQALQDSSAFGFFCLTINRLINETFKETPIYIFRKTRDKLTLIVPFWILCDNDSWECWYSWAESAFRSTFIEKPKFKGSNIEIIWTWEIWDKARQLQEKEQKLIEIWFRIPKTFVLAESFLNKFIKFNWLWKTIRNIENHWDLEYGIMNWKFSNEMEDIFEMIIGNLWDIPLVIRSSASWDARWTWTYKTVFCVNKIEEFKKSFCKVLLSYFSEDAKHFRRDAKTWEWFWIIVNLLIWNEHWDEFVSFLFQSWWNKITKPF